MLFAIALLVAVALIIGGLSWMERPSHAKLEANAARQDTARVELREAVAFREKAGERVDSQMKVRSPIVKKRRELRAQVVLDTLIPPAAIALIGLDDELIRTDSAAIGFLQLENVALKIEGDRKDRLIALKDARIAILEKRRCDVRCKALIGLGVVGCLLLL